MSRTKTPSPRKAKRSQRRSERKQSKASVDPTPVPTSKPAPETETSATSVSDQPMPEQAPSYTIDGLAAHTGLPSRTIRFYQSSGVLPKPEKRGRVAYYGPPHVERLELIGTMQDRGLRMRAIKELLERSDNSEGEVAAWLGLGQQLSSPWTDDAACVLTRAELDERLGPRRPGFIAELARAQMLEIQSEDAYLVPSPGLLHIAVRLDDSGLGIEVAQSATQLLQRHLAKAARDLAKVFTEQLSEHPLEDTSDIEQTFGELRNVSLDAVRLIFAREMEQHMRKMVESGAAVRLEKKVRKRRRKADKS